METTVNMVRVQSYFPRSLLEQLRLVAEEREVSLAELIRKAVSAFVKEVTLKGVPKSDATVVLKSVAKLGFKGPKNLASGVDKFLYG
jgi:hypothetical protein